MTKLLSVLFCSIIFFATELFANELSINEERIENCLQFSDDQYQCIGKAAGFCSDLPSGASPTGMVTCMGLERTYWRTLQVQLLAKMQIIAERVDAADPAADGVGLAVGIQNFQAGWADFRDALCKAKRLGHPSPDLIEADCLMRQDGDQAIYLMTLGHDHF